MPLSIQGVRIDIMPALFALLVVVASSSVLAQQKSSGSMKQLQTEWLKITFDDLPSQPMLPGDRPIR